MSIPASVLKGIIKEFNPSVATGASLNLVRTAKDLINAGRTDEALEMLARAATGGSFKGQIDQVEKDSLKKVLGIVKKSEKVLNKKGKMVRKDYFETSFGTRHMPEEDYKLLAETSSGLPLVLNKNTFPSRMSDMGFVNLSGTNINRPSITIKDFTGKTKNRFIDEGARNLITSVNLDPERAKQYATFYNRTEKALGGTGIPLPRVGGAWATLSEQADPERNARLLINILNDPTGQYTSQKNQMLALKFLSGQVDDPAEALGRGKRFNFMHNSIDPSNPDYFTADTRYAQNLQGIKNTYSKAPFADMFAPRSSSNRYGNIYIEPGLEAARRMGMNPSELQAAAWGNWRDKMYGIPFDLSENILGDIQNFDYDPRVYADALDRISNLSSDNWKSLLKGEEI